MFGYGKGEDRRGGRAEMGKIGFTWDRRRERVSGVAFPGIWEDLAYGAVLPVARMAMFAVDGDAKDGCGAVHAWVGCSRGGPGADGSAGGDVFEGGGEGVSTEDIEGVAWAGGGL